MNISLGAPFSHPCRFFFSLKNEGAESCKEQFVVAPSLALDEGEKIPESWSQPKVVVIGAGLSGLSAAHRLVQCGICDITVLEATDRPGGRIQSSWFINNVAELGARSIQGASAANSVYNLAVKENLKTAPASGSRLLPGIFYTSRGKAIPPIVAYKARSVFNHIEKMANSLYYNDGCEVDVSMETFMTTHIKKEVMHFPEAERQDALMVMNNFLHALEEKTGSSAVCVDTKFYGRMLPLPGGDAEIPEGFVGILAPLIRDLPDCSIKYCTPVKCIKWDICEADKPRACVECEGENYLADYVIVTTPLGFLKDKADTFFVPNLPVKKMTAINSLGYGHLNYLFLHFPEPLWSRDEGEILFAWHPDDFAKTDSWVKGITSLQITGKSGQVLKATIAGQEAITMETLEKEKIIEDIHNQMKCFLSNPDIPKASSILRSKWSNNRYTQGALTFISRGSNLSQIQDLSEPIPEVCQSETPVLLFAGEHTCANDFGTVHGARNTGLREANKVLQYTRELRGAPSKQQNF